MPTVLCTPNFDRLEKLSPLQQRMFFRDHLDEFIEERVLSDEKNVQLADHLAVKRKRYTHHFICTGFSRNGKVLVTEFTGPVLISQLAAGLPVGDLGVFGIVKESEKTFRELEQEGVYKIKWPKSLIRYDVQTIIKRARSRIGETFYGLLENNCEQLVSWCICGLNVSLQIKEWYFWIREGIYAACASAKEGAVEFAIKFFANISDDLVAKFNIKPSYLGFMIGGLLETGIAVYECGKALKKWMYGSYSYEELKTKMVEILAKGICRFGGGVAGSVIGTYLGPLGSLVGGVVGAGVGHLVGFSLSWCYKNWKWLDG